MLAMGREEGLCTKSPMPPAQSILKAKYAGLDNDTGFPYRLLMTSSRDFAWDDSKAERDLVKHGVPFPYATRVFLDDGMIEERVFAVVYTQRQDVTRIISARRCNAKEARLYGRVQTRPR
jgi:uncharacterized DUF497 family protein